MLTGVFAEKKEYQDLEKVFEKYTRYYDVYGNETVSEEQDEAIRNQISELKGTYDYYNTLLSELRKCINDYQSIKKNLKVNIYAPVRKMRTMHKSRK